MRNRRILAPGLAVAMSVALLFPACGSSPTQPNDVRATPSPTPAPPVKTLVKQGAGTGLGDHVLGVIDFTTAAAGTLEAHVDWTFPTSNVGVYLVKGTCSVDQFNARTCQFLASSESSTQKPRVITTASTPAGAYELLVGNFGPNEEAISFQIFLTTGGSASSASVGSQQLPNWTYRSMVNAN